MKGKIVYATRGYLLDRIRHTSDIFCQIRYNLSADYGKLLTLLQNDLSLGVRIEMHM